MTNIDCLTRGAVGVGRACRLPDAAEIQAAALDFSLPSPGAP